MADLSGLREAILADALRKVEDAVAETLRETQNDTPTGPTGVLADTERVDPVTLAGEVFLSAIEAPAEYASYVDRGRRAIVARPGKVLVWEGPDGTVFSKRSAAVPARNFFSAPMAARWERALLNQFG